MQVSIFRNISYPKRFYGIATALTLIVIVFIGFNASTTFSLWRENERLAEELPAIEAARSAASENAGDNLENPTTQISSDQVQSKILEFTSEISALHSVKLTGLSSPVIMDEGDLRVSTYSLELSGSFSGILKVIHALEYDAPFVRIASVRYQSVLNRQTKTRDLKAHVYLQHLIQLSK